MSAPCPFLQAEQKDPDYSRVPRATPAEATATCATPAPAAAAPVARPSAGPDWRNPPVCLIIKVAKLFSGRGGSAVGLQPDRLHSSVGWWHLCSKLRLLWSAELAAPRSRAGCGMPWGSCTASQPAKRVPQTPQARAQSWQQPLGMGSASTQWCWLWTHLQNADGCTCFNRIDTSLHVPGTDKLEHCPVAVKASAALPLSPHSWEGDVFCHALCAQPGISLCTANKDWLGQDLL